MVTRQSGFTMKAQDKITEFASEYHKLIAGDHHKDKDCHWSIETRWSYGQEPKFIVRHRGYLFHDVDAICDSYAGALAVLRDELKTAVTLERLHKGKSDSEAFEL